MNSADESAVRELMHRMADGWENGDANEFASVFSDDAQYVNAPGQRIHGRKAIAESHRRVFDTFFKGTRLGRGYPARIYAVAPDVILVESCGSVLFPGEKEENVPPNGLITLVCAKGSDGWRIVSFQNTPTGATRVLKFILRYLRSRLRSRAEDPGSRV